MFDNNNIWLRLSSIKFGEGISTQFGMIIPQTTMKNIATKLGQKLRNNSVKKLVNYIEAGPMLCGRNHALCFVLFTC
jgi:hypothetical protein